MQSMDQVTVSNNQATVSVGPGNRWSGVYPPLDNLNVAMVGGRLSQVGVGGLIIGGKHFDCEHDWEETSNVHQVAYHSFPAGMALPATTCKRSKSSSRTEPSQQPAAQKTLISSRRLKAEPTILEL
jgi:hypothetical protein